MTLVFVAITVWWLIRDQGVPLWDAARHTLLSFDMYDAIRSGDTLAPFDLWTTYPPFVHIVGIAATAVAGKGVAPPVIVQNLIFLPLLVLGCYQTAKLVYGSALAGALAAAFALGTPMIAGQFHVFMLDGPLTAMVATSVWLVLASRRFERIGLSALAGLAVGLGLLTKETFVLFVAGLVIVVLARGGWRNWRGLLAFAGIALVVAAPWYLHHLDDVRGLAAQTSGPTGLPDEPTTPVRLSIDNIGWYLWMAVNYQYLLPLLSFAAIGVGVALVRLYRRLPIPALLPELLIGGFTSFALITWSLPHDPRYSLPALVYLAVLGTGWIVRLQRNQRLVAQGLLATIVVLNTLGASFGMGSRATAHLWSNAEKPLLHQGEITFYADDGYVFGAPTRGDEIRRLVTRLHDRGVKRVERWQYPNQEDPAAFSSEGGALLARSAGLAVEPRRTPARAPGKVFVVYRPLQDGPRPCVALDNGYGVWVTRAPPWLRRLLPPCPASLAD